MNFGNLDAMFDAEIAEVAAQASKTKKPASTRSASVQLEEIGLAFDEFKAKRETRQSRKETSASELSTLPPSFSHLEASETFSTPTFKFFSRSPPEFAVKKSPQFYAFEGLVYKKRGKGNSVLYVCRGMQCEIKHKVGKFCFVE